MSTELVTASKEIQEEAPKLNKALAFARAFEIATQEDFEFASTLIQDAKRRWQELEDRRTAITKPLLSAKAGVDALFKPLKDGLKEIEASLKAKLAAYTLAQLAAREAALQRSAETFAAGGVPTETIPDVPEAKGVSMRSKWFAVVVDPDLVPRELCSPDEGKIEKAIWYADTEKTPPRPIPGLRFELRTTVAVRK